MKFKIIADSSADLNKLEGVPFTSAPLKINTAEKEYVDDANLNVEKMVDELQNYKGKSRTACPSPAEWENAFEDAENIFCVPITSGLSGSYNAARVAKDSYEEEFPGRRVSIIDTLSAGPELQLIIEKIKEQITLGKTFEEINKVVNEYKEKTGLLFMLASMKNLANNGRVNPLVAKAVGLLGIRIVGKASEKGDLDPLDKCRGEKRALSCIFDNMNKLGFKGGKVKIGHVGNETAAHSLKQIILSKFENTDIEIYPTRGLCSFYAEKGGLLVGFEKADAI
ncbi:DegV family protein [Lactococcus fujiensis]|uniref:EDD domain protein DegV family n=2 Tax=Lactococcus fujiensis TaxID=610251 RepID=A0A2A5RLP8_9LACT|nr:DegV family protein [Lactococcus fujiensis]PCS00215.1 eDD domain protein DegV family [Lactococcus fujiensis JCM 16395]